MRQKMNYEKYIKKKNALKEPYPTNILLTIEKSTWVGLSLDIENITQDNIDGLMYAIATLPEQYQQMLALRFIEGKSYEQIGEICAVSKARARYVVNHAINQMQRPPLYYYIHYGKKEYELRCQKAKEVGIDVMDIKIVDLGLSSRPTIRLIASGCKTVRDIVALKKDRIVSIKQMGNKSLNEIALKLNELGVSDSDWNNFLNV